jgi:benzodiazapine receptor
MMFFDRSDESAKNRPLIFFVLASLIVGTSATFFTEPSIATWYAALAKPDFNPPTWLFAPVWTALYILMGIAAARVWDERANEGRKGFGIELVFWSAQLVLNFFWSAIFFSLHLLLAGLVEMGVLWLAIVTTLVLFWRRDRIAGLLLLPYLVWVTFAFVLNLALWRLNG